jgi:hypothetical protein
MGSRTTVAAAAVVLLLAVAQPASAAHRRLLSCVPRHDASVVVANTRVEVYELRSPRTRAGIYACSRSRSGGAVLYLGEAGYSTGGCVRVEEGSCQEATDVTLAGRVVAFVTIPLAGEAQRRIVVLALPTGRVLHKVALAVHALPENRSEGNAIVRRLLAEPDGTIAWLQEDEYFWIHIFPPAKGPAPAYDLFALGRRGFRAPTVGLSSEPSSIALIDATLSWTDEGIREAAPIE